MSKTIQMPLPSESALGALPKGAIFQSAKGRRTSDGHSMEFTYMVGSSFYRTIINPMKGGRA